MKEMKACNVCGTLHPVEELTEFSDNLLCVSCLNTETVRCVRCGERIWMDCNEGDDHIPLCRSCFDRYYTTCEDCGRTIHYDDAYYSDDEDEPRCYSCHCRHADDREIHNYYYKPEPIMLGEDSRYFGVELEIKKQSGLDGNVGAFLFIWKSKAGATGKDSSCFLFEMIGPCTEDGKNGKNICR